MLLAALLLPAQEAARPLLGSDIVRLLEGGVTPARVAALAAERGVSLEMSPELEQRLRQAGADDALLLALVKASTPPDEAIRRLKLAELRARDADRAAALTELAEAAKLAPHWAELHYQNGLIYESLRLYEPAIAAWRRYLELRPDTPRKADMVAKLAEWEYRREKQKKAEELVARSTEELRKSNPPGALDLARQAVDADPESAAAHAKLAEQLVNTRALDDAVKQAREAVRLDPQLAEAHRQLSRAVREKGDLAEAERAARTAVRLAPDQAFPHATLATALVRQGKTAEALAEVRAAARADANDWELVASIASEFGSRKDWASAVAVYRDYLAYYPDRMEIRVNLVLALSEQGQLDEAEREARENIRRAPQNARAHHGLAWVFAGRKQWDAAVGEEQEATHLDPKMPDFQMSLAWFYRQKGVPQTAVSVYRQLIQAQPNYLPAQVTLAWTLYGMKDYTGALIPARGAVRLQSTSETHALLGTVLSEAGQLDEAYKELQEALRLDPSNAMAHNNLGVIYQKRSDIPSAIAEFREAVRLDPSEELYRNNLSRLENRPQ